MIFNTLRAKGNPVAVPEPGSGTVLIKRSLAREFVEVTQNGLKTPTGDPERVIFSA
jgi:hypothetical protein